MPAAGTSTANLDHVTIASSLDTAVFATNGTTIRLSNTSLYNNLIGIKTTGVGHRRVVRQQPARPGCRKLRPADLDRTPEIK